MLGLGAFDEDDLYAALDDLSARQVKIEQALYRHYLERRGAPPSLLLYDVTSSYFEGLHNALGEYGYNRDGKRGKKQIVTRSERSDLVEEELTPLKEKVKRLFIGTQVVVADRPGKSRLAVRSM